MPRNGSGDSSARDHEESSEFMNDSMERAVSSAVSSERQSTQNYPLPVKCEQALSSACWVKLPPERELEIIERVQQYQHNILKKTKDMNKYTAELLR